MTTETMEKKLIRGGEFLLAETPCDEVFTPEDFNSEQKEMAETAERFVDDEVAPKGDELEKINPELMKELMKKCGDLGLLMMDAPEDFGGLELDKATVMLVTEKMGPAGSFAAVFGAHSGLGTLPLVYYGSPEQKKRYLGKIINGEWIGAYALTEPEAGSDAMGGTGWARLSDDGKHYILNGTKQFITNAGYASLIVVFAKVDKEKFTAFLVEPGFPGVTIGPEESKLGLKGSSTTQVILDNAEVAVENVLGEIGKGHKIAFNILNMGRFKLAATVTGVSKKAFAEAATYAAARKQFGKPIGQFGAIREKLADMAADIYASESIVYRLAGDVDHRIETLDRTAEDYYVQHQKAIQEYASECGIAKVFATDTLAKVVDETLQIHGGYGFVTEYPAERMYRDERINRIWEGTNEINRMLIPGMILKKAMKGELPLQAEAMKAFESLMEPSFEEIDESLPYAREKALIVSLKKIFLILAGAAYQKFMEKLADEQEVLMAAADIAINIYALESAVLRGEKHHLDASEKMRELTEAVVKVIAMNTTESVGAAARRCAFYTEEGDTLNMLLSGVRRYAKYDATGLLAAKRTLSTKALEKGRYLF